MHKLKQHTVAIVIAAIFCISLILGTVSIVVASYKNNGNGVVVHTPTTKPSPGATAVPPLPNPATLPAGNDWTQYRFDIAGTGVNPEQSISVKNVNLLAQRWEMEHFAAFESTPAIVNGVIYVTNGNSLYAFDLRTGVEIWR